MRTSVSLDLRGLKCPAPVLRTKRQLKTMRAGEVLHVACTDPLSSLDIPFLAAELGHGIVKQDKVGGTFDFWIAVAPEPTNDAAVWPLDE